MNREFVPGTGWCPVDRRHLILQLRIGMQFDLFPVPGGAKVMAVASWAGSLLAWERELRRSRSGWRKSLVDAS